MNPKSERRWGLPAVVIVPLVLACAWVLPGCPPPKPPEPEILPRASLVERYNARAAAIQKLWARCRIEARVPKMDKHGRAVQGRYDVWSLDGNFLLRKPRDLALVGRALTDPVFGLYSNSQMYWFWVKPGGSTEYHGRYDGPGAGTFPIRPDYLLETLAIFPVASDVGYFRRGDEFDFLETMGIDVRQSRAGSPDEAALVVWLRQEVALERVHHDPVEVRLYDTEGEPLVISRLLDYQEVDGQRLPMKLVYRFVPTDTTFTLWLKDVSLTKEMKDAWFEYRPAPEVKQHVDLDESPPVAPPAEAPPPAPAKK